MLLLSLRRPLHVLPLRRLLITIASIRIRWTLILRLLGHAPITRRRNIRLILGIRIMLPSILLIALTRRGLTTRSLISSISSGAGPVIGLGLIARRQPPTGGTKAAALVQRIVTIIIVLVGIVSCLALNVVVIPSDDALPLRFCGGCADAAVVLTRLRVVSPISSAARILLPIAPRDRRGGLVHHPRNVAAHGWLILGLQMEWNVDSN